MATISGFRGVRYNPHKIKNLRSVVTPPYDVISKTKAKAFYKTHQYNFIRILLGRESAGDSPLYNRYSRARDFFRSWMRKGVFIQDKEPCIYIYTQAYRCKGKLRTRLGFIALLKLEPPGKGVVYPHEKTFCRPKEDRLALLKAVEANLSPIFGLYSDKSFTVDKLLESACGRESVEDFTFEGIRNTLWKVCDQNLIRRLIRMMAAKKIFIADGHHRYEVAGCYHRLMRKRKELKSGYVMMYFSNLDNSGVTIFPTHRVIRAIPRALWPRVLSLFKNYFIVRPVGTLPGLLSGLRRGAAGEHLFGFYAGKKQFYLLKLKRAPAGKKENTIDGHYQKLDAVILHQLILGRLMKIKSTAAHDENIVYTRDHHEAVRLVDTKKYQAAFFMNPPSPSQIRVIASGLKMMPHKSTYFYPKPVSGLVINMLRRN